MNKVAQWRPCPLVKGDEGVVVITCLGESLTR